MKDIIYIEDLRVKTIIGIFDWERETKQEVSIDIEFPFDCKKAAKNDSIEDTLFVLPTNDIFFYQIVYDLICLFIFFLFSLINSYHF